MMLLGVVAMSAFACVNRSLKLAPASVVVPYQYTMIVWAVVLGWLVFGDVPDAFTLTGAAIIIGAGLYILWREQIVARREPVLSERGARVTSASCGRAVELPDGRVTCISPSLAMRSRVLSTRAQTAAQLRVQLPPNRLEDARRARR